MDLDDAISTVSASILAGFENTVPPLDEWSIDPVDPESTELQQAFQGRDWKSVPHDLLRYHVTILPLFQPKTSDVSRYCAASLWRSGLLGEIMA
jgi:hypothetical protein